MCKEAGEEERVEDELMQGNPARCKVRGVGRDLTEQM